MTEFCDILYGKLTVPDWIVPFFRIPEFVRLRGVRLSNVDSFQFKDFNGPSRWEHCIGVAALALYCAKKRRLSERERIHLSLAALLHDVATPPFAHTMEHVLEGFDHEVESHRILRAVYAGDVDPGFPVFASQLPQFRHVCKTTSKLLGVSIDPDEVAKMVVGDGDLGFLLNGTLDLDNADNVTRASLHLGINVDREVPFAVADWLASQQSAPLNLGEVRDDAVVKWLSYRTQLYAAFFESSPEEHGREALLQHLFRRARASNLSRRQMIWNTDEGLLSLLEKVSEKGLSNRALRLSELVQRYRLLEPAVPIAVVSIYDTESLRTLDSPVAIDWLENELRGHAFEPFILITARRHLARTEAGELFPPALGAINIFKLGEMTKANQLPGWLRGDAPQFFTADSLHRYLSGALEKRLVEWVREKPWLTLTTVRKENVISNLEAVGDWSFRLSRNEGLHSYPSTFVHAIPSCLISALGLRGQLIVDPFGGTGQTATEAMKTGGRSVTADVNSVAVLIAKAKLTYLSAEQRSRLKAISLAEIRDHSPDKPPQFHLLEKWHHAVTVDELSRLRKFIESDADATVAQFMRAAFSAILTGTTARKGKQHGFFADNTPLAKGEAQPQYENALEMFVLRLKRNVEVVERLYSSIERDGNVPEQELKRATVLQVDVASASAADYGVQVNSVAGVITSPPYLCMSDYSLGQRLSYYWLFPERLQKEHDKEIGARRKRFQTRVILDKYLADFKTFAELTATLLLPGGFLAIVLGVPVAQGFIDANVLGKVDEILDEAGFTLVWSKWRPINWHRNHGYARLKDERIAVYVLAKE